MSVAAKVRHIEVVFGKKNPKLFLVPLEKAHSLQKLIEEYECHAKEEQSIDARQAFQFLENGRGRPAVILAGLRKRDGMTQVALAKVLGTKQSAVAAMESGMRPIGKEVAKKLAAIFDTDYRNFL